MNVRYIISFVFFVSSISLSTVNAQMRPVSGKPAGDLILSVEMTRTKKKELQYTLRLRNDGPKAVYYSTNPQDVCGRYGPYISLDLENSSVVDFQWRVFDRNLVQSLDCYTNQTGVELKRLEPNKGVEEVISINWPLSETVPPYLNKSHRKLERGDVKRLRFTVGYFDEEEGITAFLKGKPFGWFIKGSERIEDGAFRTKYLYEIQQLVSIELPVTKIQD